MSEMHEIAPESGLMELYDLISGWLLVAKSAMIQVRPKCRNPLENAQKSFAGDFSDQSNVVDS